MASPLAGEIPSAGGRPVVAPEVAAEAAVWIARLHGPSRSERMERECLAWQARSAAHREAFERCTDTWQDVPRVTVAHAYASAAQDKDASPPMRPWRRWSPAMALAVVVAGSALILHAHRAGVYETGVGEQQRVLLADGSRMTLNTDTHVSVDMGSSRRLVEMRDGEALFEVAKDPGRSFVVLAGSTAVIAHGTAFSVRVTPAAGAGGPDLTVTLREGRVSVQRAGGDEKGALAPVEPRQMQPGERLRLTRSSVGSGGATMQSDRPNLESVFAWERSEAAFDDVSLADAVAEMNRYSRTPIVLLDAPSLGRLRVSGSYRTGNSAGFARAVATLHGLRLSEQQGRLELARPQ